MSGGQAASGAGLAPRTAWMYEVIASRFLVRQWMRWSIWSRSCSSVATSSGVASLMWIVHGLSRHGMISLMILVGRPASSSPLICTTRSTWASA